MVQTRKTYFPTVVECVATGRIVGAGTLVVERKFIHACANRGHIEDVVVDKEMRGRQMGKAIIELLKLLSEQQGCYKVSLECKAENVGFYQKCGFTDNDIHFMWKKWHE